MASILTHLLVLWAKYICTFEFVNLKRRYGSESDLIRFRCRVQYSPLFRAINTETYSLRPSTQLFLNTLCTYTRLPPISSCSPVTFTFHPLEVGTETISEPGCADLLHQLFEVLDLAGHGVSLLLQFDVLPLQV